MKSPPTHYSSLLAFLFFVISIMFLMIVASIFGISLIANLFKDGRVVPQAATYMVSFGFLAILLGMASIISLSRFLNKPDAEKIISTSVTRSKILIGIISTGLILLSGYFAQDNSSINWLVLPLLTVPATTLPIWLLLRLATKDLPLGSRWRTWSVFGLSMSLTPLLLFILEVVAIIFIFILLIIYIIANPQISFELQKFSEQYMRMDPESSEAISLIMQYLANPGAIFTAFTLFSLIIPMMEEALKPLGVWLLAGKLTSAAQGFAFGALCGAGFALAETINVSAQTNGWASLLFARIGTGAMHITTSALIGSAIISAWHEHRYLRLLLTYLLAILLHGIWNAIALTNGFSIILANGQPDRAQTLFTTSTIALVVLALGLIAILIGSNRFQRRIEDTTTPESTSISEEYKI